LDSPAGKLHKPPRRQHLPKSLPAAAYPPPRSSKANGLRFAVLAKSSKIIPTVQTDFNPNGFGSSSPTTPATQSVSPMCRNDLRLIGLQSHSGMVQLSLPFKPISSL
jgi:hypothetical protein